MLLIEYKKARGGHQMSAIESAFATAIVDQETHDTNQLGSRSGTSTPGTGLEQCAQHDITEKRIFGLRMWSSRSVERGKSE